MSGSKLTVTGLSTNPPPNFESAVSLNNAGTVLAVGAPFDGTTDGSTIYRNGQVVIFRLSGNIWTEDAIFQGSPLVPSFEQGLGNFSGFGYVVALNAAGDLAVVSAPGEWKNISVNYRDIFMYTDACI